MKKSPPHDQRQVVDSQPASPPWRHHTDPLRLLAQLNSIATQIERALQQQFDSSLGEFEILDAIREKPLPQTQLCRRIHRTAPVVSRWLKRLVDKGYAASHPPRHDRRERVASLLKRGVNQHQRTRAHLAGILLRIAQELSPTLEARLLGLHRKLSRGAACPPAADAGKASD